MLEFEPGLIIWTCVSFGLVVFLLYKVLLPPLLGFLEQREKLIAGSLADAAANQKKAEELSAENRRQLQQVRRQAEEAIERARVEGEQLKKELFDKGSQQAARLVEQAKQELAQEKNKIVSEIKKEAAELVAIAAGKVLRKTIDINDHRRIIEESLAGLK